MFITDVHALGLQTAQGLIITNTFYWDTNDQTRAFSKRFAERDKGIHPTMVHAGVYASVLHYLKAVEALKSDDGTKVVAKMKEMPTDDPLFGKGTIRVDGRKIHPAYLVEVKKPSESKGAVGLLQGARDDPGRPGVPAAGRRRVPAGEVSDPACLLRAGRRATRRGDRRVALRRRNVAQPTIVTEIFGDSDAGALRPAADRAHQRRVLRDAVARARRDLRPAQHHQLHARRAVHDGRVRRVVPAQYRPASATGGRC